MKMVNRGVVFLTIVLLIAIFPTLTGVVDFTEGDAFPDSSYLQAYDFIAFWEGTPDHYMSSGLMMGMSIFVLSVVYRGGRSNHTRINDRSLEEVNVFQGVFSVTVLFRAVFVFFFSPTGLFLQIKNKYLNKTSNPINDSQYEEVLNHAFHC